MFKYHLIIFILWCEIRGQDQTDTKIVLPRASREQNKTEESSNVTALTEMSGHTNVNIDQQIFYVYDSEFKRFLLNRFVGSTNTSTHKFYSYKLNWNRARQTCVQEGGHLAIINSDSEEELLLRMLREKNVGSAWLGLHDLYEEGDWVTVMDQSLRDTGYTKWTNKWPHSTQPDNAGGHQNCANLVKEGGMDDYQCNAVHNFICEFS